MVKGLEMLDANKNQAGNTRSARADKELANRCIEVFDATGRMFFH